MSYSARTSSHSSQWGGSRTVVTVGDQAAQVPSTPRAKEDSDVVHKDQVKTDGSDTGRRRRGSVYTGNKPTRETETREREQREKTKAKKEEELKKALHKTKETLAKEQNHTFDVLGIMTVIAEENKRMKVQVTAAHKATIQLHKDLQDQRSKVEGMFVSIWSTMGELEETCVMSDPGSPEGQATGTTKGQGTQGQPQDLTYMLMTRLATQIGRLEREWEDSLQKDVDRVRACLE